MKFNLADFTLNEIIIVNREYLIGKFFKIHVENKDYVFLITRVGVSLMNIEIYNINRQINEKNPIEYEIINYNQQYESFNVDFFIPETFYHDFYLGNFIENYEFELSELSDKTINLLHSYYEEDILIMLISNDILYKNLKNPRNIFEEEFSKFIKDICLNEIMNNTDLQIELKNMKEYREKQKDELEKHMENLKKDQRLMADKYRGVNSYSGARRTFNAEKFLK